jgi:hypothetical protein
MGSYCSFLTAPATSTAWTRNNNPAGNKAELAFGKTLIQISHPAV